MSKPTYFDLLKDPQWQKKKSKIMDRDNFQCRECGDGKTTLNVHHTYYTRDAKPWEYPDESLRTLCEKCHELRSVVEKEIKKSIGALRPHYLHMLHGYLLAIQLNARIGQEKSTAKSSFLTLSFDDKISDYQAMGIADFFNSCSSNIVCNLDGDSRISLDTIIQLSEEKMQAEEEEIRQKIAEENRLSGVH